MQESPIETAKKFVQENFPNSTVAILAGSVVLGNKTKSSDLDIVIIDPTKISPYRESFIQSNWPIEAFILTETSYLDFFQFERFRSNPFLARMCAYGQVIKDNGSAEEIQREARESLLQGPNPWGAEEILQERYLLTDVLDDLIGSQKYSESLFIANHLSTLVAEFILRVNGQWIGEGKWLLRALKEYNADLCKQLVDALQLFYKEEDTTALVNFVDQILEPYGGRLFEGFIMKF